MKHNFTKSSLSLLKTVLFMFLLTLGIQNTQAQCTNTTTGGYELYPSTPTTMPTSNTELTIATDNYSGDYTQINGAVAGQTIKFTGSGYVTVHSGTYNGPVIAFGNSPLTYSNNFTGTVFAHWNLNSSCGKSQALITTKVQCVSCPAACINPTAYSLTGGGSYCSGGSGVAVGLSNSESGVTYQLKISGTNTGSPVSGTGAAISFGTQTNAGTYTVLATRTSGSCTATMSGSATVSVNTLPVTYTVTGGGSYCSGGTGVAIGLSNSETGVTYQLRRGLIIPTLVGSPVSGTTGSAISFGNQTTADNNYTVLATRTTGGCTATMTGNAMVSITTSTSNTTTASACGTYTWSVNGTTYTTSGTYSKVTGCNTETLVLTITPNTSNTTTASACDTYTWSVNGTTYTTSGTYTSVTGCNTEILNLTITPSTSNTTTASACGSYTWSVNETTYTTSGTYSKVTGCYTEILVLTITPNTSNTTTASACNTYTWGVDNQTYTTSGTYTSVTGCNTEILVLTIKPNTSNTTTASACSTYSWGVNNQTYTTSGTYTSVTGCNTEILVLTITPNTSNTTTASACDSYTWSVNGQTYTTSGIYTKITDCHTEILNLTVTPSTSNTTTFTANGSYTWSVNGQTYTNSGTHSFTEKGGCNTETLVLTIVTIPNTKIKDAQCGTTLATPTTVIAANTVTGAQGYRFEVSDYNDETVIDTVETTSTYFRLSQLSTGIVYNKKYSIRVAVMQNGIYGNFGLACPITAPAAPLTKITDALCNTTLASTTTAVGAITITGAQGYKFEVSEYIGDAINPTFLENIETTGTYFRLTGLTNGTSYKRKYQIRVAGKFNGEYAEFGQACTVTTPNIPLTKIKDDLCNTTLASLTSIITANTVSGIDGYRFEVSEYDLNNVAHFVESIDAVSAYFRLTQLTAGTTYSKKYAIRVAAKSGSLIGDFGASCDITTPLPISKIKATQCGVTLAALNTAVACDAVTGAQGYMFEVKENGVLVGEIPTTTNYFRLTQLSGGTAEGRSYSIAVAVKFNNVYGEYNEVAACTVYTPKGKKLDVAKGNTEETSKEVTSEETVAKVITLKAYPNPFVSTFKLDYTPITLENVIIKVYDMTGKQIESRVFEATKANDQEFGTQYATGIYNVNITQGSNIQNIRVIKN